MGNPTPNWLKALVALGILVAAAPLIAVAIWPRIEAVGMARMLGHENPCVWNTPVPLPDASISPVEGKPVSYLGVTFNLPWGDLVKERRVEASEFASLIFRSGQVIRVSVGGPNTEFVDGLDPRLKDPVDSQMKEYQLERSIAQLTPSGVSIWASPRTQLGLLEMKALFRADGCKKHGIFSLATPEFKGFQYGTPQPGIFDSRLEVRLYSPSRTAVFEFDAAYPRVPIATQSDINLIVQSLRVDSAAASASVPTSPMTP
jgi:hypothetical protein